MNARLLVLSCLLSVCTVYTWGLAGVYTINPSQPASDTNFENFSSAITALNASAPTAPVTFNVLSGAFFNESCPSINASAFLSHAVVFQKDNPGGINPVLNSTSTTAGFKLVGGRYFTFDGIDVCATASTCPVGYYLGGSGSVGAHHNTIKNCTITMNPTVGGTIGVRQVCSGASQMEASNSYNTYENLQVIDSSSGIKLDYTNLYMSFYDQGCVIRDCIVSGSGSTAMTGYDSRYGIHVTGQDSVVIENNEISNIISQNAKSYGIYLYSCRGDNHIRGNQVHGIHSNNAASLKAQYGIHADLYAETTVQKKVRIYNNMIWNIQNAFGDSNSLGVCGVYLYGVYDQNEYYVDFNTIYLQTQPASVTHGIFFNSNTAVHYVRNNIVQVMSSSATRTHSCIRYYNTPIGAERSVADHNVIYTEDPSSCYPIFVHMETDNYSDITSWYNESGQDLNSYMTDPLLISADDPHLQSGTVSDALEGGSYFAGALSWVVTDLDGDTRDANSPDIGADEAVGIIALDIPIVEIDQADGSVLLEWIAVSGATAYRIEASNEPETGFSVLGTTSDTTFSDPASTKQFYRVIAVTD